MQRIERGYGRSPAVGDALCPGLKGVLCGGGRSNIVPKHYLTLEASPSEEKRAQRNYSMSHITLLVIYPA